ncbi:MAG TPA: acyl-CoA dehydrogenase [Deltaproteobacteria bacterium]|nr:MAG: acyl-CoA dehydrogenase [Deltaproteobacteria bacterium]HDM79187.1 acyl-CoA dehydrogenase [Deltaproteobacteria bacterium]
MDFQLSEEQKMLKETVRQFVEREIRPHAMEWDEKAVFVPDELIEKYAEMGLLGMTLPERYGGQGLGVFEAILVIEEIAKVSCLAAFPVFESNVGPVRVIELFGTEEQKKKYLPRCCRGEILISVGMTEPEAGSAVTDLRTRAVLKGDHYIVNGTKRFVTGGGHSEVYVVYVRLSDLPGAKGIGALIIEKGTPGFVFGKQERFMGLSGFPSCDLIFEDCKVPKENLVVPEGGFKRLMQAFDIERLGNATMSLGIATGALEESIKYSKERKQFGKEICEFQAVQLMLADMAMKVEAARLLIYRAAVNASRGYPSILHSSIAKCFSNEIAKEVTDLALQIHGGYGYSKEYPIERMLRDSRGWPVAGGTVQMQRINIASELIGRRFNQRK